MARNKLIDFVRNLSYTFASNIISLFISALIVLIIPKLVGPDVYGYYQLYLFYTSYVGVSYFGWCDGIYLRIGGKYYENLDKNIYSTQFRLLGLMEIIIYLCIFLGSFFVFEDGNKLFIIGCTCVAAVGMCLKWFFTAVLQPTARMKEYASVIISERIIFFIFAMFLMLSGYRDYKMLLITDVFSKYISLGIAAWYCRDIVFSKAAPIKKVLCEIKENIFVGIKRMFSLLSSSLIIGVVRFGVESRWDISTFGKVSLTISLSNMVITAINSVGVVMYPMLRRTSCDRHSEIYKVLRVVLMSFIFGVMIVYKPMQSILTVWLPKYTESIRYVAILFPICVYESKMSVLVTTYYNALRLENLLMKCNMAALLLSTVCTIISTYVLNSVTAAIFSVLLAIIFRCVLSELLLAKHININVIKDIAIELVMTISFIISNWNFGFVGMLIYAICYVLYLFLKRKDLKESINFVKSIR